MTIPELDVLSDLPLFAGLPGPVLESIREELTTVNLVGGKELFAAGDPADCMYVILYGRMAVLEVDANGAEVLRNELTRGNNVGEMALLTGQPRSATVRAVRDTTLLCLSRQAFDRLIETRPAATIEITRQIIGHLQRPSAGSTDLVTVAVLPYSDGLDLRDFTTRLVQSLEPFGRTLLVHQPLMETSGPIWDEIDPASFAASAWSRANLKTASTSAIAWMNRQETDHRFVVYEAAEMNSRFSHLCARQADCVLLVASSSAAPRTRPLRLLTNHLKGRRPRLELVLVHGDTEISNTSRFLEDTEIQRHHHLLPGTAGMERLARHLAGKSVGLVLGGGGARGFAHVGVIRAMRELGVPIDRVGGTSIGALVGALCAQGWTVPMMMECWQKYFRNPKKYYDFTLPTVAILKGERFHDLFLKFLGERQIEDLPLEFFCTSTNLTQARMAVHRRGSLVKYVNVSQAVPGIVPPLVEDQDLYCDGGVLSNLPVEVMQSLGSGPIIAVDVSPRSDDKLRASTVHTTRQGRSHDSQSLPGILDILMRACRAGSSTTTRTMRAGDLYIDPAVGYLGTFDWERIDEFVNIGYERARTALETWSGFRSRGIGDTDAPA